MKKFSKKSLSLLSAGLFLLNSNFGLVNQRVLAVDPPVLSPKSPETYKFEGEDGKIYTLCEYVGRGNQSLAYRCIDEDNVSHIVKIPLDDFLDVFDAQFKELEGKAPRAIERVKKLLARPTALRIEAAESAHVCRVPCRVQPLTPRKVIPPTPREAPLDTPSGLPLDPLELPSAALDMSEIVTAPSTPRKMRPKKRPHFDILPQKKLEFDDSDSDNEGNCYANDIPSLDFNKSFSDDSFHSVEKSSSKTDHAHVDATDVENLKSRLILSCTNPNVNSDCKPVEPKPSLPRPDEFAMRNRVIDSSVRKVLKNTQFSNVVSIKSFMPHIESDLNQTLMSIIRRKGYPTEAFEFSGWVKKILSNILIALVDLHGQGVYHRDIKTDNIFINGSGEAIVGDLGAARCGDDAIRGFFGTPGYMAPELFLPACPSVFKIDPAKVDVFALGMTALEMLADFNATNRAKLGKEFEKYCLFRNTNIIGKLHGLKMRVGGGQIPQEWMEFLRMCLNPDIQKRATAKEALGFLMSYIK